MRLTRMPAVLAGAVFCVFLAPQLGATLNDAAERAWMGAEVRNLEPGERERLGIRKGGILVHGVDAEGPAARAGVEAGDVLTELDGRSVGDASDFQRQLQEHRPGQKVRVTVRRNSRSRRFEVELAARPHTMQTPEPLEMEPGLLGWRRLAGPQLGVWTADLDNAELAAYFGVPARGGVLVTGVVEGAGAASAGIQGGDVILAVGPEAVHDTAELRRALSEQDEDKEVEVRLRRKNREESVRVRLESSPLAFRFPHTAWRWRSDDLDELKRELGDLRRELEKLQREMHGGKE